MMEWTETVKLIASFTSIMGGIVMIVNGVTYWRKRVEYNKKITGQVRNISPKTIINISEHPMILFEDNWHYDKKIIDIKVGKVDVNEPDKESERIVDMILKDCGHQMITSMPIIYAFHGMSGLTQYLLAKIHGLSGDFPLITTAVKTDNGWLWKKPVDLHNIRVDQRLKRHVS